MAYVNVHGRLPILGGEIEFNLEVDNVELPDEMYRAAGYVAVGAATTLVALYGRPYLKPIITAVIRRSFEKAGVQILRIFTGSLHVALHCSTAEGFLEVLADHKKGKIKESLEKEFSTSDIKVEGLKVEIKNMEQVNKRKEAIEIERLNQKLTEGSTAHDNSPPGIISPRIIVQGGVYTNMDSSLKENYRTATKESARTGYAVLMNGGTAIDAVEAAVRVLESHGIFNAGLGSNLNCDGEVECDAMIMEGDTLKNGAVIGGKYFIHPVSVAKKIMTETKHCALSANGALKFAHTHNIPHCAPKDLISQLTTPGTDDEYPAWKREIGDTVSSVAMDSKGTLACATSTGGTAGKSKGRVGDAPLIGCGAYANKTGSATCAGAGESIMKVTLARQVVYNMESGQSAQESAENALKRMENDVDKHAYGGIIAIDKNGNFGKVFNTSLMVWASTKGETLTSGMEEGESVEEPL